MFRVDGGIVLMRLLKGLNAKWTAGLTATLLLSVFSLPVSAVGTNESCGEGETRCASAEWGRLAQGQTTEERRAESIRLNREGLQLSNRGQFREALEKFQQALAIVREMDERQGEGAILSNLGTVYIDLGQYTEAIEYFQQALAIDKEVGDGVGEGRTLSSLGEVYRNLGQYTKAIEYHQQALAIVHEAGDLTGEGTTLNNLGNVYINLGQYREAIEYYQQALAIHREVGNRAMEGATLNNLGNVYNSLGQYKEAIEYCQQALAINKEVGNRAGEGTTLNNLGNVYNSLGQYKEAIEYYQQALAINKEVGNRAGEGTTLSNLSEVYHNLGQYIKAIEYFQQALAIVQEVGDRAGEGRTLNHLSNVYNSLGQYKEAIEYYQQALAIRREIGDRAGEGATLNNLGMVYLNLGQYPKALRHFQKALTIIQDVGIRAGEGKTLNNLGLVYSNLGQYKEAMEYYQQALAIVQEVSDHAGEGTTLNNLGLVYNNLGQYPKAVEYYQQALAIVQEVGNRATEGATLNNLGAVYRSLGQYPKAIEYYQQALAILREVGDRATEGATLNNLGAVYFEQKQYAEAEENLYAAITIWESLRSSDLSDADKISLFDTQAVTYRFLQQTLIAQNKTNTALEISERGRARAFVELLARQLNPQSDELPQVDPPSIAEIKQIAKAQNATLVQYSLIPNTALYIWVIQPSGKIDFRSIDLKDLDSFLADFLSPNELSESDRLEVVGVRGADKPDQALTSFIRGTQESLRSLVRVRPTEGAESLSPAERLQKLHQLLIQPIADLLPTNPEDRVIFIPHQSLFYVPFPALQDGEEYLIEKHTILTAPSIQVLNLTRQHQQRIATSGGETPPLLIVGNPTMPRIADKNGDLFQLTNLPGAENEAIAIAKMLGVEPLLGAQATETAVSQRMTTSRLIHFATHGLLDDFGYGIPGAIALAPDSSVSPLARGTEGGSVNPRDGLLTSGEIVTLTQNNPLTAELVVLSACDTGLGDLSGDGVVGLSRSLITAGVPSIVVSLWKVPDAPTKALMTDFYTNLYEKKMDKAQALRQAMLTAIEGNYPDPQAWAAFTLIGEAE